MEEQKVKANSDANASDIIWFVRGRTATNIRLAST
jgi:hypothetical protein